jgi:GTPase SAR1 family protein
MASLNLETGEVCLKVVYYGSKNSGKSSNLQHINANQFQERQSKSHYFLKSYDCFEFLPIVTNHFSEFKTKVHLWTLPNHDFFYDFNARMLENVDVLIHVVDTRLNHVHKIHSQIERIEKYLGFQDSQEEPRYLHVTQFNHRDSNESLALNALKNILKDSSSLYTEAIAYKGEGVYETLNLALDEVSKFLQERDSSFKHFINYKMNEYKH